MKFDFEITEDLIKTQTESIVRQAISRCISGEAISANVQAQMYEFINTKVKETIDQELKASQKIICDMLPDIVAAASAQAQSMIEASAKRQIGQHIRAAMQGEQMALSKLIDHAIQSSQGMIAETVKEKITESLERHIQKQVKTALSKPKQD